VGEALEVAPGVELDLDVGVLLLERGDQRLGRLDGLVAVVDEERELDAPALTAAVVASAAAAACSTSAAFCCVT